VGEYQKPSRPPPGGQPGGADAVSDALDELAATIDVTGRRSARPRRARGSAVRASRRVAPAGSPATWPVGVLAVVFAIALIVAGFGAYLFCPVQRSS